MYINKKYNIKTDYLEFNQPPLDGSIENLKSVSEKFREERASHSFSNKVVTTEHKIKTLDNPELLVLEITPKTESDSGSILPVIVYYHGGGFFSTFSLMQLEFAEQYCLAMNCKLFMIQYRLSTDHPFPAGFDDCYAALEWVVRNTNTLKVNASQIVIYGDSAGGALAAGVTQKVKDTNLIKLKALFLIYPALDCDNKTDSAKNFIDTPVWTSGNNKIMWDVYLRNYKNLKKLPKYASPSQYEDLTGLPKTYIEIAEFDPVRDEAIHYAERLKADGVEVEYFITKGTIHAFDFVKSDYTNSIIKSRLLKLKELFNG